MYIGCYHRDVYLHNIGTVLLKSWSVKNKKTKQKQKTHNKTKHWHHSFDC